MAWLINGALFFTFYCQKSFYRGFYLSVAVGYGLFWDEPVYDPVSKTFCVFHLMIGTILTSCSLSIIARHVVESKKLW